MLPTSFAKFFGLAEQRAGTARFRAGLIAFTVSLALCSVAHAEPPAFPALGPSSDDPLFSIASPVGSIDYVLGRRIRLGRTGFRVGGFSTLEIDKEESGHGTLEIDSLNFLILWEPADFFRAFAEIELEGLFAWDMSSGGTNSNVEAVVERVYGDLTYDDALNLRFGKFQTPVGIWNLVPAEPFTWTAIEPILVENAFDEHQTGAAFFGTAYPGSNTLDYWLYGQVLNPLDPPVDDPVNDRSVGGRLRYGGSLGDWAVGSSFLASERKGKWNFLGGLDAFWQIGPLELQGEWSIVRGDIPERDLWGVYLQGVYHLGHHHDLLRGIHFVGRYEYFDPSGSEPDSNLWNVGLTWTPWAFLIVKAGYQLSDQQSEFVDRGFFSSISVLF
jgi:hypothetical protein